VSVEETMAERSEGTINTASTIAAESSAGEAQL